MKKSLLLSCLLALLSAAAAVSPARAASVSQEAASAPDFSPAALRALSWLPLTPPVTSEMALDAASQTLNQAASVGAVAALALPADRGALKVTLRSLVREASVYAPNVVVLDQQLRPAAFYPASHFPYRQPGVMAQDRLEGTMRLSPALGQKQIYLLIYTTRQDLARATVLKNPARAYAEGVGNAAPAIPDPVARHAAVGVLNLKVTAEQDGGSVTIGQTAAPPAPRGGANGAGLLGDTENYFNDGIRQAVRAGDIDKALRLMNEAERLGSASARETFIRSVKERK